MNCSVYYLMHLIDSTGIEQNTFGKSSFTRINVSRDTDISDEFIIFMFSEDFLCCVATNMLNLKNIATQYQW